MLKTLCCECEAFVVNLGSDHLQLQCSSSPAPCFGSPTLPILVEKAFSFAVYLYTGVRIVVQCAFCTGHSEGMEGLERARLPCLASSANQGLPTPLENTAFTIFSEHSPIHLEFSYFLTCYIIWSGRVFLRLLIRGYEKAY